MATRNTMKESLRVPEKALVKSDDSSGIDIFSRDFDKKIEGVSPRNSEFSFAPSIQSA